MSSRLDRQSLLRAITELTHVDEDLATLVRLIGDPPLWRRRSGLATLVRIVLEQQVSLASGTVEVKSDTSFTTRMAVSSRSVR